MTNRSVEQHNRDVLKSQAAMDEARADRRRSLDAIHRLEAALGAAAPGRESKWFDTVLEALRSLEESLRAQWENSDGEDSLMSEIVREHPRLEYRVKELRHQQSEILRQIAAIRKEFEDRCDAVPDYADIRQRLGWLLTALRHLRAREIDLIYEAYATDIGEID